MLYFKFEDLEKRRQRNIIPNQICTAINVYILLLITFHLSVKYIRFILALVLCVPPNLLWCSDPGQFTLAAFIKIFFKYTRSSQVILDISTCQWQAQTNTN